MQVGVPPGTHAGETRVSATPETIKKLISQGHQVIVQSSAGVNASQPDSACEATGVTIGSTAGAFGTDLVLRVVALSAAELAQVKNGAVLVGMLNPFDDENITRVAERGITASALEAAPRTSRAQSLDVLSSQANVAGYKTVMPAASYYPRFMPMLMTVASTVKAVRVLILDTGVADLQAIATAKRLGAVIKASNARPTVKEQIESLDAKFVDVPYETNEERECTEDISDYARPMPASWMEHQAEVVHERAKQSDIVITAALIPDHKTPTLLHEATVAEMKPGSVVIDLAAAQGDNYPLTEADQVVVRHGVTIIGHSNLAALVLTDALALHAHNILDFLEFTLNTEGFSANFGDDIVAACLMYRDGQAMHKSN